MVGKNRIAALRKRRRDRWVDLSLDATHKSPERGPGREGDKGGNQSFPPASSSFAASTRAELGPIKSEPIFVERPIKPLEN